jgi:hypothetical protein
VGRGFPWSAKDHGKESKTGEERKEAQGRQKARKEGHSEAVRDISPPFPLSILRSGSSQPALPSVEFFSNSWIIQQILGRKADSVHPLPRESPWKYRLLPRIEVCRADWRLICTKGSTPPGGQISKIEEKFNGNQETGKKEQAQGSEEGEEARSE